jgi:hypothetical protein
MRATTALLASAVVAACTPPAPAPPVHAHVVCAAGAGAETVSCDTALRGAAFDAWLLQAVSRPGSTFEVLAAGNERGGGRRLAAVCVPATWGGNVAQAKATFVREARARVTATRWPEGEGVALPRTCRASGDELDASSSLRVASDGADRAAPLVATPRGAAETPAHATVLCALSTSAGGLVCNRSSLLRAYDAWVTTEGASEKSATFRVEVIGKTRDSVRRAFDVVVPAAPPAERVAYVLGARAELARAPLAADRDTGSAIAEALQLVGKQLGEKRGRGSVTLLSDLRQVGSGWNFEANVARGIAVSAEQRARVLGCTDVATLDHWTRKAVSVASAEELSLDRSKGGARGATFALVPGARLSADERLPSWGPRALRRRRAARAPRASAP